MSKPKAGKSVSVERTPKLTPKQRDFARLYPITQNGTKAAIAAGYKPERAAATASENVRKSNIQEAIKESLRSVGYNEDYISQRLLAITEAGTSDKALKQASVRDANKSLELGARLYGLLGSNNTNNTLIVKADLSTKTPTELREELIRLREEEEKYLNS